MDAATRESLLQLAHDIHTLPLGSGNHELYAITSKMKAALELLIREVCDLSTELDKVKKYSNYRDPDYYQTEG